MENSSWEPEVPNFQLERWKLNFFNSSLSFFFLPPRTSAPLCLLRSISSFTMQDTFNVRFTFHATISQPPQHQNSQFSHEFQQIIAHLGTLPPIVQQEFLFRILEDRRQIANTLAIHNNPRATPQAVRNRADRLYASSSKGIDRSQTAIIKAEANYQSFVAQRNNLLQKMVVADATAKAHRLILPRLQLDADNREAARQARANAIMNHQQALAAINAAVVQSHQPPQWQLHDNIAALEDNDGSESDDDGENPPQNP